jgi:hypothetical protein
VCLCYSQYVVSSACRAIYREQVGHVPATCGSRYRRYGPRRGGERPFREHLAATGNAESRQRHNSEWYTASLAGNIAAISDMDPDDAPWADSPDESSEPPGGFVTSGTNSWSRTPDGRPGSSGDDSRCSRTPRSPVPYGWAEQFGFDSSDYPQGFNTEDGDLGDVDG